MSFTKYSEEYRLNYPSLVFISTESCKTYVACYPAFNFYTGKNESALSKYFAKNYQSKIFPLLSDDPPIDAHVCIYTTKKGQAARCLSVAGLEFLRDNESGDRAKLQALIDELKRSSQKRPSTAPASGAPPPKRLDTGNGIAAITNIKELQGEVSKLPATLSATVETHIRPIRQEIRQVGRESQEQLTSMGRGVSQLGQGVSELGRGVLQVSQGMSQLGQGMSQLGQRLVAGQQKQSFNQRKILETGCKMLGGIQKLGRVAVETNAKLSSIYRSTDKIERIEERVEVELRNVWGKNGSQAVIIARLNERIAEKDRQLARKDAELYRKAEDIRRLHAVLKTLEEGLKHASALLAAANSDNEALKADVKEIKAVVAALFNTFCG